MIKASHHRFYTRFFNLYVPYIMRSDFKKIEIEGSWDSSGQPALIIGNHISWWDGFWALYLNNRFLHKKFHVMMLKEQLKNRKFLSKAGAFSIDPGKRTMIETLGYSVNLLNNPQNAVAIFPQGRISSITSPIFEFGSVVDRIIRINKNIDVHFYSAFVDYFSERKPSLYFYLENIDLEDYEQFSIAGLYRNFYNECRTHQAARAQ